MVFISKQMHYSEGWMTFYYCFVISQSLDEMFDINDHLLISDLIIISVFLLKQGYSNL